MKKNLLGFLVIGVMILSGCSIGVSTEKQLSDTLSKMNDSESEYRNTQSEMTEMELTEQKIFEETMELTKEDVDKLRSNVTELEKLIEERLGQLGKEKESMKEAEGFIKELDTILEKASESEKSQVEKLKVSVQKRYELHRSFVDEYRKLASLQKEFYSVLSKEDVKLEELKQRVEEINEQNAVVKTAIADFNEATKEVNSIKDDVFSSLEKDK
ncbi:YkyA family protein [Sporosarcina thermotolerans]|uniref:YkyA family protein n=1 Tax=Sporosarcina thermotolerans TaxID=633404 RepID=A0AAW9A6H6_9BACL|nr:YkyA family protein [Sporosarcina thermotolerans]MDW0115875.1 YkyA family protein [Sporosarcina thermotolerans]WHT46903.1 YkyA family protein [Sporosarcina thermotolerans]